VDSSGKKIAAPHKTVDPAELEALLSEGAQPYGVVPAVHEDDFMWRYIFQSRHLPTPESAVQYYLSDGAKSAQQLKDLIAQYVPSADSEGRYSLLEFACGYGMVSRHVTSVLGNVDLTCCDIHDNAINFIRERLGEHAVLSAHVPEDVVFNDSFDVVFALSFFSHMPNSTFARWLATLFSAVKPGGILLFTTHGLISAERQGVTIPENGFWFRSESEQKDLEASEYGTTLTTQSYVVDQLATLAGASLTDFRSGLWWGHQDLYVVTRTHDPDQ
jgi:SAM-dependent methyltransferase